MLTMMGVGYTANADNSETKREADESRSHWHRSLPHPTNLVLQPPLPLTVLTIKLSLITIYLSVLPTVMTQVTTLTADASVTSRAAPAEEVGPIGLRTAKG